MELIDYFLSSKNHVADLDTERRHNDIASSTLGYSPASVERLFDEALLGALRDGRSAMTLHDILKARREIELGLPEPTEYTPEEGNDGRHSQVNQRAPRVGASSGASWRAFWN